MLASGAPQEEDTPSEKKKRRLLGRHRDRPMTTQVKPEFDWARQQQIPSQR
jgi:hypothetical protein